MSLANLHQTQHQAFLQLCRNQEQRIKDLPDARAEDRQVLQGLVQQARISPTASVVNMAMPHAALTKMGPQDDPEVFLELYVCSTGVWGWPVCWRGWQRP